MFAVALVVFQVGCVPSGPSGMPVGLQTASGVLQSLSGAIPGLSYDQAAVGAGSMLRLAQARLSPDMFEQIADGVPGTEALMDRATNAGLPDSDRLTGMSSLRGVMNEAGISQEQQEQLPAALGALVAEHTDQEVASAFSNAVR
jgi:hypothetical protein